MKTSKVHSWFKSYPAHGQTKKMQIYLIIYSKNKFSTHNQNSNPNSDQFHDSD